jgi:uncharacterized protein (TIGR02145 family)
MLPSAPHSLPTLLDRPKRTTASAWRSILLGSSLLLPLSGCEVDVGSPPRSEVEALATVPVPWNGKVSYGVLQDYRDGIRYNTVRIGSQEWMAENLRHASFPQVGICHSSDPDCARWGRFYRWSEALALPRTRDTLLSDVSQGLSRGICPSGWHIPSHEEVWILKTSAAYAAGLDPSLVATVLKARAGWKERDTSLIGTDSLGFRMLASGSCDQGSFSLFCSGAGTDGSFWTSSESSFPDGIAFATRFTAGSTDVDSRNESKSSLRNVRCLRD